jgi:hypothetical protein
MLPDDVYTLLDNLIAFTFRNEDELRHLSRSGLIDKKSINSFQHLEKRQCIAVGKIPSNYPLFIEVSPQIGALMGEETRKTFTTIKKRTRYSSAKTLRTKETRLVQKQ